MQQLDAFLQLELHKLGWPGEACAELVLAAIVGGLVGLEREIRGRQAGFRTNVLVCVGSALVMIVSARVAFVPWPKGGDANITIDPARIAYGIMTGIGFLGAGTIVQSRGSVHGLTTAAALWCTAAIGMSVGMGMYLVAIFSSLVVLLALWLLDHVESVLPRTHFRDIVIRRRWEPGCVDQTIQWLQRSRLKVRDVSFERARDDHGFADIELRVAFPSRRAFYEFERDFVADGTYELIAARNN